MSFIYLFVLTPNYFIISLTYKLTSYWANVPETAPQNGKYH